MVQPAPSSVPSRAQRSRWSWVAVALALALGVVLVLALVPLNPETTTSVRWFRVTSTDSMQPGYNYSTGFLIPPYTFCPPADALGPGMLSFTWKTLSGAPLISFDAVQTPVTLGPQIFWLYILNNSAFGGYSISTESPFHCQYPLNFAFYSATQQTVLVAGTFSYNSTSYVPLL
jgi:hypothetical protein